MNAKIVVCLSIVAMLSPAALAIIAGFNADIHMDIPNGVANDFHIEGTLKSGVAGGNWNRPPVLVGHIDGAFPFFTYSITPDTTNPDQNVYKFKADWSGPTGVVIYKYCDVLHLGLFFDLECNNLVIDLVGWWTKDGKRLGGFNGGAIPIAGFMVQDQMDQGPQRLRILNDSQLGGGGGGGGIGIPLEIQEMEVLAMPRQMALDMFGSLENIFPELRLGGRQEQLPWVPVANSLGPISSTNPTPFMISSFFDIFLEVSNPGAGSLFPVRPIHIEPSGVLLTRMQVAFTNNAGQREFRFVWHMHEAHPLGDLGDAPDSTNHFGAPMTAYPPGAPVGVQANFPTVFQGPFPFGPMHLNPQAIFLGAGVSGEMDADLPPDMDGPTNILPPLNQPNQDGFDDGLLLLNIKPCQPSQFSYIVTVNAPVVPQMFVNVWFDWNQDGDWDDTLQCAAGVAPAPEWAVQNQVVPIPGPGVFAQLTPQFMPWFPAGARVADTWMRITISEQPWIPPMPPFIVGYGGSGPQGGYKFGETEDYYLKFEFPPDQDFGDAPDGFVPGYPTLLASNGARHTISPNLMMGLAIDAEFDGQPNANATGDDLNGVPDDEDGVVFGPLVAGLPAMAMVQTTGPGFLQGWIDFNSNNSWADAGEQIAADVPIPGPGLHPVNFAIPATAAGKTFARFRFSSVRKLPFFGPAPDGEVEDYQIEILKPAVEIDAYGDVASVIELTNPDGTLQSIPAGGSATTNVYFEGANDGDASDSDGDGLDEVKTEMTALNLSGTAPQGPFTIKLKAAPASTGEMEETVNNTPGRLDVPPFTAVGTLDSFFDIYVQVDIGGVTLTTANPLRVRGNLTHKPANPCDVLIGQNTVPLLDANGNPTGYRIKLSELVLVRCKLDWGDAPDGDFVPGYPTLAINNGARHEIDPKIFLGNLIDAERDGQPNATATGDDLNNLADEDGVKFLTWPLVPGQWAKIQVTASVPGSLFAWVDFDANMSWAEPYDQIAAGTPLAAGPNLLSYFVPMTAKPNSVTFARFRFTTSKAILSYTGAAPDGEVEDYLVKIGNNCGIKWLQPPDTTPWGIDIAVDNLGFPRTIADDFLCTSYDRITDVHLWGSWLRDQKGAIKKIHLSIHGDDPIGPAGADPQNTYSKPDKLLWQKDFFPGDFTETLFAKLPDGEFWWDPMMIDSRPIHAGDHQIWQINIKIKPEDAFFQEGTPEKPVIYWLDVRVDTSEGRFGWKTRRFPGHFMDDAVFSAPQLPVSWIDLHYPQVTPPTPDDRMGQSIDMAFALTSRAFCCGSADLNCDGLVDLQDFAIFASQWLQLVP